MPTKIEQVRISVAMVIPEIGFDEVPMRPVMREDTVAKKKPKIRMRTAASGLPYVGRFGAAANPVLRLAKPKDVTPR